MTIETNLPGLVAHFGDANNLSAEPANVSGPPFSDGWYTPSDHYLAMRGNEASRILRLDNMKLFDTVIISMWADIPAGDSPGGGLLTGPTTLFDVSFADQVQGLFGGYALEVDTVATNPLTGSTAVDVDVFRLKYRINVLTFPLFTWPILDAPNYWYGVINPNPPPQRGQKVGTEFHIALTITKYPDHIMFTLYVDGTAFRSGPVETVAGFPNINPLSGITFWGTCRDPADNIMIQRMNAIDGTFRAGSHFIQRLEYDGRQYPQQLVTEQFNVRKRRPPLATEI